MDHTALGLIQYGTKSLNKTDYNHSPKSESQTERKRLEARWVKFEDAVAVSALGRAKGRTTKQ
eukprot:4016234-Amphidinium_carterae.1